MKALHVATLIIIAIGIAINWDKNPHAAAWAICAFIWCLSSLMRELQDN